MEGIHFQRMANYKHQINYSTLNIIILEQLNSKFPNLKLIKAKPRSRQRQRGWRLQFESASC